jgi:hypothetical protein
MAKKYRQFKRIRLKAKTAKLIVEKLVDKTFADHQAKCWDEENERFDPDCGHHRRGSLQVARLIDAHIKIGVKRATLDVPCPHARGDADAQIKTLNFLAVRLRDFGKDLSAQCRRAWNAAADEIEAYANRNAMEVLAEAVIDRD